MLVVLMGPGRLAAQHRWGLALEIARAGFSGQGRSDVLDPETGVHPSSTTIWGLRLDRTGSRVGWSLGLSIATTGVEFESDDASAEARNVLELIEISPQVSVLLLEPREAALRIHLGPVIDHWSPDGADARTRIGALAALGLAVPFSARFGVEARWEMTLTVSVFVYDELPPVFSLKSGWCVGWVGGVRLGL
jgi:hypothetical protein